MWSVTDYEPICAAAADAIELNTGVLRHYERANPDPRHHSRRTFEGDMDKLSGAVGIDFPEDRLRDDRPPLATLRCGFHESSSGMNATSPKLSAVGLPVT